MREHLRSLNSHLLDSHTKRDRTAHIGTHIGGQITANVSLMAPLTALVLLEKAGRSHWTNIHLLQRRASVLRLTRRAHTNAREKAREALTQLSLRNRPLQQKKRLKSYLNKNTTDRNSGLGCSSSLERLLKPSWWTVCVSFPRPLT